jgi:hypothetical protein
LNTSSLPVVVGVQAGQPEAAVAVRVVIVRITPHLGQRLHQKDLGVAAPLSLFLLQLLERLIRSQSVLVAQAVLLIQTVLLDQILFFPLLHLLVVVMDHTVRMVETAALAVVLVEQQPQTMTVELELLIKVLLVAMHLMIVETKRAVVVAGQVRQDLLQQEYLLAVLVVQAFIQI